MDLQNIGSFWDAFKISFINFMPNLASALVIALIGFLIAIPIVKLVRKGMEKKKADPSLASFICKAVRLIVYILTLFAALSALKVSITGLVAFFSAGVAAIALALKDRLSDIASGIVILFTKPFVTGDFIEFGSRQGFVQKIDIIHTNILTYDGTNVIVPNSVISSAEVNNYTAQPIMRDMVNVPIPYEANVKEVKEILYGVLNETKLTVTDETHQAVVRLEKFGESSLDFTVRCYCEFKDYWTVFYDVTERVKEALDKNDIAIPFNQLDVHMVK